MVIVLSSLGALGGIAWLLVVVAFLVEPTPGVRVGAFELLLSVGVGMALLVNFVRVVRGALAMGRTKVHLNWCRACANEWIDPGSQAPDPGQASATAAVRAVVPAPVAAAPVPSPASAAPAPPAAADAGLRRMMDALRDMPLPENLRGWNQVISIEIQDRPDLWYRWVIEGDRWQVLEGQTTRATLRLVAPTEIGLARRFAAGSGTDGYSLLWPSGLGASVVSTYKCSTLIVNIAAYLRSSAAPVLQKWQAERMSEEHGVGDSTPVDQLVNALGSPDADVRKAAADALERVGWTPPPENAEAYWVAKWDWSRARAATTNDRPAAASTALPGAPSDVHAAIEYLTGYLKRKDVRKSPAVRQSIVRALAELGPPAMAELYDRRFMHVSLDASYQADLVAAMAGIFSTQGLVGRIGFLNYPGLGPLLKLSIPGYGGLKDELVAAGPSVVEPLIAALRDESVQVRQGAAEVLGRIGDVRAVGPLTELTDDPNRSVRGAATGALGKLRAHVSA